MKIKKIVLLFFEPTTYISRYKAVSLRSFRIHGKLLYPVTIAFTLKVLSLIYVKHKLITTWQGNHNSYYVEPVIIQNLAIVTLWFAYTGGLLIFRDLNL